MVVVNLKKGRSERGISPGYFGVVVGVVVAICASLLRVGDEKNRNGREKDVGQRDSESGRSWKWGGKEMKAI